jgi:hypothetical protein
MANPTMAHASIFEPRMSKCERGGIFPVGVCRVSHFLASGSVLRRKPRVPSKSWSSAQSGQKKRWVVWPGQGTAEVGPALDILGIALGVGGLSVVTTNRRVRTVLGA